MNKQKNRGITLIALVITIVILVILVGVSVSVAINTGLIANSKKAVADYDVAQMQNFGSIENNANFLYYLYTDTDEDICEWENYEYYGTIRPVVTLKSDLKVASDTGDGSADSPWKFE